MKNWVAPEIEEAVVRMAYEYPAYGQARAANELKKQGTLVSSGGIRSIWLRHGLETFKKRLAFLEEKALFIPKRSWLPWKVPNGKEKVPLRRSKRLIRDI